MPALTLKTLLGRRAPAHAAVQALVESMGNTVHITDPTGTILIGNSTSNVGSAPISGAGAPGLPLLETWETAKADPPSPNSGGTVCAANKVGTTRTGPSSFSRAITRSIFSSVSWSSPYPDFASIVVVPPRSIQSRCRRAAASKSSSLAARVNRTVRRMPPPAAAISW